MLAAHLQVLSLLVAVEQFDPCLFRSRVAMKQLEHLMFHWTFGIYWVFRE